MIKIDLNWFIIFFASLTKFSIGTTRLPEEATKELLTTARRNKKKKKENKKRDKIDKKGDKERKGSVNNFLKRKI